jgi:hypothetical protein
MSRTNRPAEVIRTVNNQNASGSFGGAQPTSSTSTSFRTEDQNSGNRFQPFSGRGYQWG